MKNTTVKLQIPLDKKLRDQVAVHAKSLGFSSVQDFTRVMYQTTVSKKLEVRLVEPEVRLSPETEARYVKDLEEYEKDRKTGKVKSFHNSEDALDYLHKA